ncbi:MAG: dipicolinate synthase subunit B [Acidobacteriota bacterium]
MQLKDVSIGVVLTGSHCTIDEVMPGIKQLKEEGARITAVLSFSVAHTDNRFHSAQEVREELQEVVDHPIIDSITGAEPIGPRKLFDVLVVAPCTGNTLAKLANGITDTPALMAVKAHLRNQRPVVIAVSTNDGLGLNAKNLGYLLGAKSIYFVPFGQDNPSEKANSIVARMDMILETVMLALKGEQIQPVLLGPGCLNSGIKCESVKPCCR